MRFLLDVNEDGEGFVDFWQPLVGVNPFFA